MEEVIRIPHSRVGVVIGKEGATKKLIEERCEVEVDVKRDGEITLKGDAEKVYFAKDVIKAIGRGFSPEIALKLLEEDYMLEIIDLDDYYNTENAKRRIRGRVIGKEGRAKKEIERATDAYISVFGDTVSIIAPYYTMPYAKEAVEKLIKGAKHSTTFNYLSRAREEITLTKLKGFKHKKLE